MIDWRAMPCEIPKVGTRNPVTGYVYMQALKVYGHRLAWTECFGPIPEDKPHVLHHCDNPPCWQPLHLFVGTPADNLRDMAAKGRWRNQMAGRTACSRGHPYVEGNFRTVIGKDGRSYRQCRVCVNQMARERSAPFLKGRFHETCRQGHPLGGENLRLLARRGKVERICRECVRVRNRAAKARRREPRNA